MTCAGTLTVSSAYAMCTCTRIRNTGDTITSTRCIVTIACSGMTTLLTTRTASTNMPIVIGLGTMISDLNLGGDNRIASTFLVRNASALVVCSCGVPTSCMMNGGIGNRLTNL